MTIKNKELLSKIEQLCEKHGYEYLGPTVPFIKNIKLTDTFLHFKSPEKEFVIFPDMRNGLDGFANDLEAAMLRDYDY